MRIVTAAFALLIVGCAAREPVNADVFRSQQTDLQAGDLIVNIPQLSSCTDNPDHALRLKLRQPVTVLVHGCFGSSGQFRGLAQVMAFHGQQSVCFTYDDRANLTEVARQLRRAIDLLTAQVKPPQITVMGHSQGALIAHKSLTSLQETPPASGTALRLVTISGPFGGIAAANTCGKRWLYPVTLGLLPLACFAVTGAKWTDITSSSRFILEPGTLIPEVSGFLKIDTDERGSCRRERGARCLKKDEVFSLLEQHSAAIEADDRMHRIQVVAGHVEIVGDESIAPQKLIAILQEQGAILPTAPEDRTAFNRLLLSIYH